MMFAALFFERDPLQTTDLAAGFFSWLRYVGGIAALGMIVAALAKVFSDALARKRTRFALIVLVAGLVLTIAPSALVVFIGKINGRAGEGFWISSAAVGGLLFLGLTFYLLMREAKVEGWGSKLFALFLAGSVLFFGLYWLFLAPAAFQYFSAYLEGSPYAPEFTPQFQMLLLVCQTLGAGLALAYTLIAFVQNLIRLRWRRIWAITLLTCNEVRRNRVMWAYLGLAVVFLFGTWFIPAKPESQVYIYVQIVFIAVSFLLLLTTSLTAAFGLHNDIKNQTIHTVLTKPVERYEVVLGRFLGYTLMMTLALVVMISFSLIYLVRGVHPTAKAEHLKARVPIYGQLVFEGTTDKGKGENVGDEWEYRGYISGPMPGQPLQSAVWLLTNLSRDLANRDKVPCEFTFSIYRTTTGDIRGGVLCSIEARTWRWNPSRKDEYTKRLKTGDPNRLARIYGYFSEPSVSVTNGATQTIQLPAGLFQAQLASASEIQADLDATQKELQQKKQELEGGGADPTKLAELKTTIDDLQLDANILDQDLKTLKEKEANREERAPLQVWVQCIDRTQFVGMAKYDLYLLDREQSFEVNFFKGALGIWLFNVLVIGLGVVFSTLLNGVVSWLCVMFVLGIGLVREYVIKVAFGTNEGGGPARAWLQLVQGQMPSAEIPKTPTGEVANLSDEVFRWFIRGIVDVFPDISLFDFSFWVSNGFDVSMGLLFNTGILLVAYLLPWLILAYYMFKSREIASTT